MASGPQVGWGKPRDEGVKERTWGYCAPPSVESTQRHKSDLGQAPWPVPAVRTTALRDGGLLSRPVLLPPSVPSLPPSIHPCLHPFISPFSALHTSDLRSDPNPLNLHSEDSPILGE